MITFLNKLPQYKKIFKKNQNLTPTEKINK